MVLSITQKDALKRLEPTILNGYEMEFFAFLSQSRSNYKTEVRKDKLFFDYIDHVYDPTEFKGKKGYNSVRKNAKTSFEKVVKKLHNVFWNMFDDRIIFGEEMDENELYRFYDLLKHIQKSDERIVRWIILHLFYKGKNSIEIAEIKKFSEKLIKSDLKKNIKKIINNRHSIDVVVTSRTIRINRKAGDEPKIEKFLINELEFIARSPKGSTSEDILQLLDHEALSQKELSRILEVSAPQLSLLLKELRSDNLIKFASEKSGERFYITDCDHCFDNRDKDKCRCDAIKNISGSLKKSLNVDIDKKLLDETFKENQSLLKLESAVHENTRGKDPKIYPEYMKGLAYLFQTVFAKYAQMKNPEGDKLVGLESLFFNLGDSFLPGYQLGVLNTSLMLEKLLDNADIKISKKKQEEIMDKASEMRESLL